MSVENLLPPMAAVLAVVSVLFQGGVKITSAVAPPVVTGTAEYSDPVYPGQTVLLMWQIEKAVDCGGQNGRVWSGEDGFHLTEPLLANGLSPTDGVADVLIPTRIPGLAPPGTLRLEIVGWDECEGMKRRPFRLGPVEFTVLQPTQ